MWYMTGPSRWPVPGLPQMMPCCHSGSPQISFSSSVSVLNGRSTAMIFQRLTRCVLIKSSVVLILKYHFRRLKMQLCNVCQRTLTALRDNLSSYRDYRWVISNPVVYSCYEKANHRKSSFEHRSHRDTLPQGQRPSGAKPLANRLATGPGQDDQRDR